MQPYNLDPLLSACVLSPFAHPLHDITALLMVYRGMLSISKRARSSTAATREATGPESLAATTHRPL